MNQERSAFTVLIHPSSFILSPSSFRNMFYVGTLEVRLRVRESRSLKDKRQVIRSITDRLREQFGVAISEVDARDQWQLAVLGVAAVGDEYAAVKRTLDLIAQALRGHPVAEFLSCEQAVLRTDQLDELSEA
jgi:uncharacterized protein YlxP (DUF503 family)